MPELGVSSPAHDAMETLFFGNGLDHWLLVGVILGSIAGVVGLFQGKFKTHPKAGIIFWGILVLLWCDVLFDYLPRLFSH